MATKGSRKITLSFKAGAVPGADFTNYVSEFLGLINEVSFEVSGRKKAVESLVSAVHKGSLELATTIEARIPDTPVVKIVDAVVEGVRHLEKKSSRPPFFSDSALRRVASLADLASKPSINGGLIRQGRKKVHVRASTAKHAKVLLDYTVRDEGTVEGILEMGSLRGKTPHCNIYDTVTDSAIECRFEERSLLDEAMTKAWGRRVAVSGLITYSSEGTPLSVSVSELYVFPLPESLPSASDVYGILSQ